MIDKAESLFRSQRRWISRGEWSRRLYQLPTSHGTASEPGLVLLQIDGLARKQFDRAMKAGRLPFLRKLMNREHYKIHNLYSGLPSSTPAVQAELFYGVRGAVPSFGFYDREKGEARRMVYQEAARGVEEQLRRGGAGLLAGGSAYGSIYAGGAAESHFCAVDLGWETAMHQTSLWRKITVLLLNAPSFFRMLGLGLIEFGLAWVDLFRGVTAGQNLWKELQFVPVRVAIGVFLREFSVAGATMDLARGLPVVHVNFLGYDEQAHRRGPSSRFAHWTLRGIDRAIRHLHNAAMRSPNRDYTVWIYSDHGQEEVIPYLEMTGKTIAEGVGEALGKEVTDHLPPETVAGRSESPRAGWTGWKRWKSPAPPPAADGEPDPERLVVVAPGPVGHVYGSRAHSPEELAQTARKLVETALVPLVLFAGPGGDIRAVGEDGETGLDEAVRTIIGDDRSYEEEMREDLRRLATHPKSGDWILLGWRNGRRRPVSFSMENGAHGGPGRDERNGAALLPPGAVFGELAEKTWLRPSDLRRAALIHLQREPVAPEKRFPARRGSEETFRVMTYNVHGCRGLDGKLSPSRIARVIARENPDVVALQEIDVGRARSGFVDQAREIADWLAMRFHFHPAFEIEDEQYGLALLSHYPLRLIQSKQLPGLPSHPGLEPRGAQWAAVDYHGREVHLVNTHLGLRAAERRRQIAALLGNEWLGKLDQDDPLIICGDMNALPASFVHRNICTRLQDAQDHSIHHRPRGTLYGRFPIGRIDHVFVSSHFQVNGVLVPSTALTRVASDHLPLCAEVVLEKNSIPIG